MSQENKEYIEVYQIGKDGKIQETGKIVERGTPLELGEFVIGVHNWIMNSKGEILVQKRSMSKSYNPGRWCAASGLRKPGEKSDVAGRRETREELGINIPEDKIKFVGSRIADVTLIVDIFFTMMDVDIKQITIQPEEVDEVKWVTLDELLTLDIATNCQYIKKDLNPFVELAKRELGSGKGEEGR